MHWPIVEPPVERSPEIVAVVLRVRIVAVRAGHRPVQETGAGQVRSLVAELLVPEVRRVGRIRQDRQQQAVAVLETAQERRCRCLRLERRVFRRDTAGTRRPTRACSASRVTAMPMSALSPIRPDRARSTCLRAGPWQDSQLMASDAYSVTHALRSDSEARPDLAAVALVAARRASTAPERPPRWPVRAGGQRPVGRNGKPLAVWLAAAEPRIQLRGRSRTAGIEACRRRAREEALRASTGHVAAADDAFDGKCLGRLIAATRRRRPPAHPDSIVGRTVASENTDGLPG